MRVLLLVNSLRPGGAEKHVVSLANHLGHGEFHLSLACLHPGRDLLSEIEPGRLLQVIDCGVRSKLDLTAARVLAKAVDDGQVDTILCTNAYAMLYGVLARRFASRRVTLVVVFHTTLLGSWRSRLQQVFYWPLFRTCDRLVYVCEAQRRHWRRRGLRAAQDVMIYNGIDSDWFDPAHVAMPAAVIRRELGFGDGDLVVGICAAMRPEKAHGDLLQAVARLRGEGIPVRCMMIGDGPERPAIERQCAELGLRDHVVMVGRQADVRAHVAACDVMALVSHAVETFSIAALESMALARPMVMSRIGGAREQVRDGANGFTYNAGDIESLANGLRQCVDVEVRRRMGVEARRLVVERFSVAEMARHYEELLRGLGQAAEPHDGARPRSG